MNTMCDFDIARDILSKFDIAGDVLSKIPPGVSGKLKSVSPVYDNSDMLIGELCVFLRVKHGKPTYGLMSYNPINERISYAKELVFCV